MEKEKINTGNDSNRAFEKMLKPAKEWLLPYTPKEIAAKSGIFYDAEENIFSFKSMGQTLHLTYPDFNIEPMLEEYHYLIALHYLAMADGTPLSADVMTLRELKDGMFRGSEFDQRLAKSIVPFLKDKSLKEVREVCEALGGEIIKANADLCVVFPFLPRYPVTLKLWFADEEFEASGKILVNAAADHYLTIEDAVMAATYIWESVEKKYEQLNAK